MENLRDNLSWTLTGSQLIKVYMLLADEVHPYEADVRKVKANRTLLSLCIRPEDKQYFQNLIKGVCDETKA